MEHKPIIIERTFKTTPSKLWNALTDNKEMKHWYFNLEDFRAEVGFQFQFSGGPSPDKQYLHLCEVTEVIPEQKLTYSWKYKGYAGISYVSFELFPDGENTKLKLSHEGLESFPNENADFARHNFEEGWDSIINESLQKYLEN
ncbi:MAG: SRPBCC domain-containing protein [Saprospiraceae bacterium]|nr:SRPBCC domain-containing protein [Candidatus Brachybacter algidus]